MKQAQIMKLFRAIRKIGLLFIMTTGITGFGFSQVRPPVYIPDVANLDPMKAAVEPLIKLSVEEVILHVPS